MEKERGMLREHIVKKEDDKSPIYFEKIISTLNYIAIIQFLQLVIILAFVFSFCIKYM